MPAGISFKTRIIIDRGVGLWPKRRRMVESSIIGSEGWHKEIQETLDRLRTHATNYSEAKRLADSPKVVNEVLDRIDFLIAPAHQDWCQVVCQKPPPGWKRPIVLRGKRKDMALKIAGQLSGHEWIEGYVHTLVGKLDPRQEWLLHEIYTLSKGACLRNFLVAIAKDAGVWPAPKWWRVTRRLLGDNRSFQKRSSYK